jgi:hypothetical protein
VVPRGSDNSRTPGAYASRRLFAEVAAQGGVGAGSCTGGNGERGEDRRGVEEVALTRVDWDGPCKHGKTGETFANLKRLRFAVAYCSDSTILTGEDQARVHTLKDTFQIVQDSAPRKESFAGRSEKYCHIP